MNNPTVTEVKNAARLASLLSGCNCNPDITVDTVADGIHYAHVAHDTWCALLTRKARRWN